MNKNIIIIGGAIALLVGGAVLFVLNNDSAEPSGISNGQVEKVIVIQGHQIPAGEIVIDVGTTIVWENKDSFIGLPYNRHTITTKYYECKQGLRRLLVYISFRVRIIQVT